MKLPDGLPIFPTSHLDWVGYEALVRDCANQYDEWIGCNTPLSFREWLERRYGLEPRTDAPANNLPTWDECALRVTNSDFLAKRKAEGGYGPEADSKTANALHRFIYEYDDADPYRSAWFLHRLELLLAETYEHKLSAVSPDRKVGRGLKHQIKTAYTIARRIRAAFPDVFKEGQ